MLRPTLALALLVGCAGDRPVTIALEGRVGDAPAACGQTYPGVGTTATELTLEDLRLYVHDVRLVTSDGRELPVALEPDGVFSDGDVALVDLEDGSAGCPMGTAPTNATIRGTIPEDAEITGIRFRLGVPEELNHVDPTTAPSPLNVLSMHWSWNAGYKFLRIDGRTPGLETGFFVHLGSTGCVGDGRGNVESCVQDNRPEIALDGFDPDTDAIAVDVAGLLAGSDLDADAGGSPGCQSGFDDPDCAPIFDRLGLPFDGAAPTVGQGLFRVVAR